LKKLPLFIKYSIFYSSIMEDIQKKNDDSNFLESLESSSEYDGSYSYEASEIEKVKPQLIKSNESHCDPLDADVQANERSGTPPLQSNSWASEMSLYDMLSPRKTLGSVRIPRTPATIPTPLEFQRFNWKKMEYVLDSCATNDFTTRAEKSTVDAASTAEPTEANEEEEEVGLSYPCESHDDARGETHKRLKYVEEEIDEIPTKITSDLLPTEPVFDYNNLLVNYLPPNMDSSMLRTLFSPYGAILSCKVVVDHPSGLSKGYGFVKFETSVDGIRAQRSLDKFQIGRKKLKVSFSRKPLRGKENKHQTNLYLSNLDPKMEPADLKKHFKACGYVVQCKILKNEHGVSKQIGFVRFDNSESAKRAIARFDGQQLDGTDRTIKIRIAGTPRATRGRESKLTHAFDFSGACPKSPSFWKPSRTACYVSGFDVTLPKRVLREVFEASGCRKVRNIRVIRRQHAPYAFVNFFNNDDAAEAASTLNNYHLGKCTLTVRIQT